MVSAKEERFELFARCASGFEAVLAQELKQLHAVRVRPLQGGVSFFGDLACAYRACLWSRVATRIQVVLARVDAHTAQNLYDAVLAFPWETHIQNGATIAVQAHGTNAALRNTQFTSLKVKDAVCDRLRNVWGARPDVDPHQPDFEIDISLHKDKATLYLNLSGASLHRRGYRESGVQTLAPLKETLAAGILLAAGWQDLLRQAKDAQQACWFIDPMCGSGTLAIEAALMAADIAPGLLRTRWGFESWVAHDSEMWRAIAQEAQDRAEAGRTAWPAGAHTEAPLYICAGDKDAAAIATAQENARRAGVAHLIDFSVADAARLLAVSLQGTAGASMDEALPSRGLLATNPPYGVRMQAQEYTQSYTALAQLIDQLPSTWRMAIISPDASLDTALAQLPSQVLPCYNGPLQVSVRIYEHLKPRTYMPLISLSGKECTVAVALPQSEQFAARLRKVARERAKWARKEAVSCYRIYDADLPDYALAIDIYAGAGTNEGQHFVRVAEYQAPASIDENLARMRFADALAIIPAVLDVDAARVFAKVRKRAKGGGQYSEALAHPFVVQVEEAGYTLEVDLNGHVDTGLFLDHRDTRSMLGKLAQGKTFLNLFAYTGVASVYAAGGGATQTTTVDLSQPYLAWAARNMQANGFVGEQHSFVRANVVEWLKNARAANKRYDLVFCDPPTFSNSKAMGERTFEIQRDHVSLLQAVRAVLAPGGTVVFSCNLRKFKLDTEALVACGYHVEDISSQSIPYDFARNPKIHHCYLLS